MTGFQLVISCLLSFCLPGLGQVYQSQFVPSRAKRAFMFLAIATALAWSLIGLTVLWIWWIVSFIECIMWCAQQQPIPVKAAIFIIACLLPSSAYADTYVPITQPKQVGLVYPTPNSLIAPVADKQREYSPTINTISLPNYINSGYDDTEDSYSFFDNSDLPEVELPTPKIVKHTTVSQPVTKQAISSTCTSCNSCKVANPSKSSRKQWRRIRGCSSCQ